MPAPYPIPTNNDTQDFFSLFSYVNTVTDGLFFGILTGVVWMIAFISMKRFSSSRAFTFASFISMVLVFMLSVLDLINAKYAYLFLILTAAGILWMKLDVQT